MNIMRMLGGLVAATLLMIFITPSFAAPPVIKFEVPNSYHVTQPYVPGVPAVPGTPGSPEVRESTGSIGTHAPGIGVQTAICDPVPTQYDKYYSFCTASMFPQSLSERSTGSRVVKAAVAGTPGTPAIPEVPCEAEAKFISIPGGMSWESVACR